MRMKAVPSKAERARNTKNEARFGASAVAKLRRKKATAVTSKTYSRIFSETPPFGVLARFLLTSRLPKTWLMGPHTMGDRPIMTMYAALLTLMMDPVVSYSAATSGVAARMAVLETGDRKEQKDRMVTMVALRRLENLSYTSSPDSRYGAASFSGGSKASGPEAWEAVRKKSGAVAGGGFGRIDSISILSPLSDESRWACGWVAPEEQEDEEDPDGWSWVIFFYIGILPRSSPFNDTYKS